MSDLEARIAEVLEAHTAKRPWSDSGVMKCTCGERFVAELEPHLHHLHRAHLTAMLAPGIADAKVEALREASAAAYKDKRIQGLQRTIIGIWTNNRADELEQA